MRSPRRWLSDRLLRAGTTLAVDSREIWARAERHGTRPLAGDLVAMGAIEVWSTVALRLGFLLMPARPPDFRGDRPATGITP